jgi:RNA polymerase sigma-70 factor (ECF subfamily)
MKICYRYTHHAEDSEEIMNEAFVKLYKKVDQFDEFRQDDSLLSLKGWFKRILVNTCIDHYRKNRSSVNGHILGEESDKLPDHSENALDVLSYKEIINAIKLLSPAYRTVFNLFVIEGLSHEEISKKLGISVGASKSNLSKARDNLRKLLLSKSHFNLYASPF